MGRRSRKGSAEIAPAPPFWDFSLAAYSRNGAKEALLELQDSFGLDVNMALWCLWAGAYFDEPQFLVIRKAKDIAGQWSQSVVRPMREARRALKSGGNSALYEEMKAVELKAEKVEQDMLEKLAREALPPAEDGGPDRARRVLAAYVRLTDAARRQGFSVSLLERLIETIFPPAAAPAGEAMPGSRA